MEIADWLKDENFVLTAEATGRNLWMGLSLRELSQKAVWTRTGRKIAGNFRRGYAHR